jgi:TetR/AcrR family transcriptional regulator, cholesterol catabolism regulator
MAGRARARIETSEKYRQRQLDVFRAAARTFNRLGFHIATLDDVADELGVTKPALYYYAKSKDELLFACGQMALDALDEALDGSDQPELDGLGRLCRFFRLYGKIICEDFGRCLVLTEARDLAPKTRKGNIAGRRALNIAVREIIVGGVADGSIRPCDERAVGIALFDAFNGLGRWFDPRGPTPLSVIIEQYLSVFLTGIAADRAGG